MKSDNYGPYPGPRPFSQADRDVFFGRAEDSRLLAEWWRINKLTYAVAPAGRGKTSLLNAGVLPMLTDENVKVLPVGRLSFGITFPLAALPEHNPYTLALLRSWSAGEGATRLAGRTIREFVVAIRGDGPILAAIDSTDELVASGGARRRHRKDFLTELGDALRADPRLHLLVVGREQAAGMVAQAIGHGLRYDVPALSWQAAVDAVSRPLAVSGRPFADGAAEKLVTDLMTSRLVGKNGVDQYVTADQVEPALLQTVCAWLWKSLPTGPAPVTSQDVRSHGDVDLALTAQASSIVGEIADDHDISPKRLATWLADSFITDIGTRNKQYEGVSTTARMPNAVAATFEDRHLLTSSAQSGTRWYELISDRLVEPLRQLAAGRIGHPAAEHREVGLRDRLLAAERAVAVGDVELARRHTDALRQAVDSGQRSSPEGFALLGRGYSLLGNLAYEGGKPKEAEQQYRRSMGYFGAAGDGRAVGYQLAAIGHLLLDQGQVGDAVNTLASAIARIPNDFVVRVFYATALWQLGEGRAAVAVLTDGLSIDGENADALRARGEILADLGEAREAIRDLDRVFDTDRPSTRAARGLALAELGDRLAARRQIEDAVSAGERSGPVLLYAARAFDLIGDDTAAEEHARLAADATDPPLSQPQRELAGRIANHHGR
jgi:tetratricopeptide (TPR) repeat protein